MNNRVLIADDHAFNRRMLAGRFRKRGLAVDTAKTGQEVLQLWKQEDYALIVLDCTMPDLDGRAVAREVRKLEVSRRTPIIGVSVDHNPETHQMALEAGMDAQLAKWGCEVELDRVVSQLLGQEPPSDQRHYTGSQRLNELESVGAAPGFGIAVTRRFLQQTPPLLRRLETLYREGDLLVLAELAHTLRGSAAMVGAAGICREAAELENAALCHDDLRIVRHLTRVKSAWEAVADTIKGDLRRRSSLLVDEDESLARKHRLHR